MKQTSGKEPNYGNRPIETEGVLARLVKYLARRRAEPAAGAARTEGVRKSGLSYARIKLWMLAAGLVIFATVVFAPLMTKHAVLLTLSIALPVGFVAGMRLGGGRAFKSFAWFMFSALAAVALFWSANTLLDDGTRQELLAMPITGKYSSQRTDRGGNQKTSYYVTYLLTIPADSEIRFSEGADGTEERLSVGADVYPLMEPGESQVSAILHQGYFDLPWMGGVRPVPYPALP